MAAKLELSIRGLLTHCEETAKEDIHDWRLKKYIRQMDSMLEELEEFDWDATALDEYRQRCSALKQTINYKEPPPDERRSLKRNALSTGGDLVKEIRSINSSKREAEMRKELLGDTNTGGLRKRVGGGEENQDQTVKYYEKLQEKLTEDMIVLTRNLKEQTETANKIIRKDTEVVEKSSKMADRNFDSLSVESTRLQDHSKRACKCWMWIMIALVMMIFIFEISIIISAMVMFMRIMKKKTS